MYVNCQHQHVIMDIRMVACNYTLCVALQIHWKKETHDKRLILSVIRSQDSHYIYIYKPN